MQKPDRVLWEQELDDHLSQHTDLQDVPRFAPPWRARLGHLLVASMVSSTMAAAGVVGWLIGLHLI